MKSGRSSRGVAVGFAKRIGVPSPPQRRSSRGRFGAGSGLVSPGEVRRRRGLTAARGGGKVALRQRHLDQNPVPRSPPPWCTMTRFAPLALLLTALLVPGCGPSKQEREAEQRRQEEERKAQHQAAMAEGEAMFKAGEFEAAVAAFEKAYGLLPGDAATAERLAEAKTARKKEITARYEKLMTAGRDALAAQKYRQARDSFRAALQVLPA